MASELTSETIVNALQRADPEAVRALVDHLTPVIQVNVAAVLMRRRTEARGRGLRQEVEDLTQDVFEQLLADRGRRLLAWEPSRGSAATFFGTVARHLVHNARARSEPANL